MSILTKLMRVTYLMRPTTLTKTTTLTRLRNATRRRETEIGEVTDRSRERSRPSASMMARSALRLG